MDLMYFKRYRMEITLAGRDLVPPPAPEGPEMRMPPHAFEFTPPGSLWNGWFGGPRLGIRGEDLTEQLAGYFLPAGFQEVTCAPCR